MSDFLASDERLEQFPPLGYPMRMGAPDQLAVGDHDRLEEAIRREDCSGALAYLAAFHPQNTGMQSLLLEWSLQLPQTLRELADDATERAETRRALRRFEGEAGLLADEHGDHADVRGAIDRVMSVLGEETLLPPAADRLRADRAAGRPNPGEDLLAPTADRHARLKEALESGRCSEAEELAKSYHRTVVTVHDALVNFTNAYPGVVAASCGEPLAQRLAADSLESCPAYMALWDYIGRMDARELAAFLAEHLRFHLAGPGRRGSTTIVEDDEKIRLVFDPCGSGGALRRRLGDRIPTVREAGDTTWGRAGEVPFYCTHCALNEKISTQRFGHPRMVTEFDPDPARPCGWTVYKDPRDIPGEYFRRIGAAQTG